jgi:hypothetical protein
MRQDGTNINLSAIVVDGGDQAIFVSSDIENGFVVDLIGAWKRLTQLGEILKSARLHQPMPMGQASDGIGMNRGKFIKSFPGNNVHGRDNVIHPVLPSTSKTR